ncbi:MAG: hypothetical protein OXF96_03435 [Chloroflexi bacterium]|nr:hypothetical protein [Chloroflexota bacterium]
METAFPNSAQPPGWRRRLLDRLRPHTVKGWVRFGVLAPALLLLICLALLVVFWSVLWYVLAAAFALFGALVVLMFVAFVVYAVARRRNLLAVFRGLNSDDLADTGAADDS